MIWAIDAEADKEALRCLETIPGAGGLQGDARAVRMNAPLPSATSWKPKRFRGQATEESDTSVFDYMDMRYTVEELRHDWRIVGKDLIATTGYQAVAQASPRPGMYRTAAKIEPDRHYFWRSPGGRLEAMDH